MKLQINYFVIFALFFLNNIFAQLETDAMHLEYTYIPKSDLQNVNGNSNLSEIDFQSFTPTIKISEKTKLNSIVNYRLYNFDFGSDTNETSFYPTHLHHFKYTLLLRQYLSEHWDLYFAARLNIRTDLQESITNEDLFPAATAMFVKQSVKNPRIKYGLGINFNNNNGKFRVLPTAYFQYKKDNMKISAMVPSNASINFSKENYSYGFGYFSENNMTHINLKTDTFSNPDDISYLRNMNVFIHPSYSRRLYKNLWVDLKAGVAVSRMYRFYDSDFNEISDKYSDSFKINLFTKIGLSYRINTENK